ncbi:hypothetical protein [Streptomyces griseoluteus]|uniref:hypothetical protein n=1 Tax=Streptomyces griseoluteus TaxID=29306 RepID=UPI0036FEC219
MSGVLALQPDVAACADQARGERPVVAALVVDVSPVLRTDPFDGADFVAAGGLFVPFLLGEGGAGVGG